MLDRGARCASYDILLEACAGRHVLAPLGRLASQHFRSDANLAR